MYQTWKGSKMKDSEFDFKDFADWIEEEKKQREATTPEEFKKLRTANFEEPKDDDSDKLDEVYNGGCKSCED